MVGADEHGDERGERVVVAKAKLRDGDRIILVDDGHDAHREQFLERGLGVEVAVGPRAERVGVEQHLRDRLLERGKERLVVRHQVRLADRRQRLQLGVVARPRLDVEALAADADGAGGDEDDAVAAWRSVVSVSTSSANVESARWPESPRRIEEVPTLTTMVELDSMDSVQLWEVLEGTLASTGDAGGCCGGAESGAQRLRGRRCDLRRARGLLCRLTLRKIAARRARDAALPPRHAACLARLHRRVHHHFPARRRLVRHRPTAAAAVHCTTSPGSSHHSRSRRRSRRRPTRRRRPTARAGSRCTTRRGPRRRSTLAELRWRRSPPPPRRTRAAAAAHGGAERRARRRRRQVARRAPGRRVRENQ